MFRTFFLLRTHANPGSQRFYKSKIIVPKRSSDSHVYLVRPFQQHTVGNPINTGKTVIFAQSHWKEHLRQRMGRKSSSCGEAHHLSGSIKYILLQSLPYFLPVFADGGGLGERGEEAYVASVFSAHTDPVILLSTSAPDEFNPAGEYCGSDD